MSTQGDFKANWTSVTIRPGDAGNLVAEVNMEGHATGYGPFVGTMTVTPAGAESGTWRWASTCWLEAGGSMDICGQGRFKSDRPMHFVAEGSIVDQAGRRLQLASTIDYASRTWAGSAKA